MHVLAQQTCHKKQRIAVKGRTVMKSAHGWGVFKRDRTLFYFDAIVLELFLGLSREVGRVFFFGLLLEEGVVFGGVF